MADLRITDPSILNLTGAELTGAHEFLTDNGTVTSAITAPELQSYCRGSRLTEIANGFAAAANGASLRKAADGSAIEFAVPRCRVLYRWTGTETITGTTSEVNFVNGGYTIPANTLSAGSTIDIYAIFSNNSSATTKTPRLRLAGSALFATTVTTAISTFVFRQIALTSINGIITAGSTLAGPGQSTLTTNTLTVDFTANQIIQLCGQLADAADNISLRHVEIRESRI